MGQQMDLQEENESQDFFHSHVQHFWYVYITFYCLKLVNIYMDLDYYVDRFSEFSRLCGLPTLFE